MEKKEFVKYNDQYTVLLSDKSNTVVVMNTDFYKKKTSIIQTRTKNFLNFIKTVDTVEIPDNYTFNFNV